MRNILFSAFLLRIFLLQHQKIEKMEKKRNSLFIMDKEIIIKNSTSSYDSCFYLLKGMWRVLKSRL